MDEAVAMGVGCRGGWSGTFGESAAALKVMHHKDTKITKKARISGWKKRERGCVGA
jgi:hypothetical protein